MQSTSTTTEAITRSDTTKGMTLLIAGLIILLIAMKYILFSSGLVETPRPGSFLFQIFNLI